MTQPSRTTEMRNVDHAAIRDIMHQIRDRLTVPDRARLVLGLMGHLATLMNRHQMEKLFAQLHDEVERVQDTPPRRDQHRFVRGDGRPGAGGEEERVAEG